MKYLLTLTLLFLLAPEASTQSFFINEWGLVCDAGYGVYRTDWEVQDGEYVLKTYRKIGNVLLKQATFNRRDHGYYDDWVEDEIEPKDSTGIWIFWHPNGKRAAERDMTYRPYKILNSWDDDGTPRVVDGDGYFKGHDLNGDLLEEGMVRNGLRSGDWLTYFPGTDTVKIKSRYDQGVLEGNSQEYYRNGSIRQMGWFSEGEPSSYWEWRRLDGSLLESHVYTRNNKEGFKPPKMEDREPEISNIYELRKRIGYPAMAKEAEIEGQVMYRFMISEDGEVLEQKLVENPHPILEKAVENQLDMATWKPGMIGGQPVAMWVNVPFRFKLLK